MKRIAILLAAMAMALSANSQDRTLRVNYIFSGTAKEQEISVAELCSFEGWAGRRVNMDKLPLRGNGQIIMEGWRLRQGPLQDFFFHTFSGMAGHRGGHDHQEGFRERIPSSDA